MPSIWGFLETVLAVIAGGAISLWASLKMQERQQQNATDLQAQQFRHLSGRQQAEWAHERERDAKRLQLDTLAELQDLVGVLTTEALTVGHEQLSMMESISPEQERAGSISTTERWREYSRRYKENRSRVIVLNARVDVDEIRASVIQLLEYTDYLGASEPYRWRLLNQAIATSGERVPDPFIECGPLADRIIHRIGEVIRTAQREPPSRTL